MLLPLSLEESRPDPERAALSTMAQLSFGRDHAEEGNHRQALISLRLALNKTRAYVEGGAPPVRAEAAAAALLAGDETSASTWLEDLARE